MDKKTKSKAVRFYFELGIDFVLPENPYKDTLSDDEWVTERCSLLCEEIQEKLPSSFDGIQFSRVKQVVPNKNFFTIYFSVSECYDFSSNEIWSPKKGYSGFKVKKHPLFKARESIVAKIRRSLCDHYCIEGLSLKYIASRNFVFDTYFGGFVTVEKKFTQEEIGSAGGVSYALEEFFEEMLSCLQECGLEGSISQTIKRRNRNNKYVFEVSATCYYGFSEREVVGEMALLERNMSIDEMQMIGIDCQDDALASAIADAKSGYECVLEQFLPLRVNLLRFDFGFIDQDDDVYDVCDELLMNYGATSETHLP